MRLILQILKLDHRVLAKNFRSTATSFLTNTENGNLLPETSNKSLFIVLMSYLQDR